MFHAVRRTMHVSAAATLAALAFIAMTVPANASPSENERLITICHLDDDGEWVPLSLAAPGANARLRAGDASIGDSYPGSDDLVFDSNCQAVASYAELAIALIEAIRAEYVPPCETPDGAVECEPGEGGTLPPIVWDQALAERGDADAAECPVFSSPDLGSYLHWSPEPVTEDELVELAINNWAEKVLQYDALTGNSVRVGDRSTLRYKRLIAMETFGLGARSDCPNNRGVVTMLMTPIPPEGPIYGVLPD